MASGESKLTVEALLGAPRRSAAVPNRIGSLALHNVSTHSFDDGKTTNETRVFDLATKESAILSQESKIHDALWIPGTDNELMYLLSGNEGLTQVFVADAADVSKEHYLAGDIQAPVENLKLKKLKNGTIAFVVTGQVAADGSLYNEEKAEKRSTGQIFDTAHVQIWDRLYKDHYYGLWYGVLTLNGGKWKLNDNLHNAIKDALLEPFSLYDRHGTTNNFDICDSGIALSAFDLTRTWAEAERPSFPYFVPLESFTAPASQKPYQISFPNGVGPGESLNVKLSPDASVLAFLHEDNLGASDKKVYMATANADGKFGDAKLVSEVEEEGRDPPSGFKFAGSSDALLFTRPQCGRVALVTVRLGRGEKPRVLLLGGAVQGYSPVKEDEYGTLLVSSTSFVESSLWRTVNVHDAKVESVVSSLTNNGAEWGLSPDMVKEIWYTGDKGARVQSWVVFPPNFDKSSSYPWILNPHGGPVAAWTDSWSTRWNPAFYASQGYVVICPNIAGTPGFGVEFIRRVHNEWAGAAFRDIALLMKHLETLPYLDQSKALYSGASYSAYLLSWMMGDDIIKKFCGAVWHDGRFDLPSSLILADLPKSQSSFNGPSWFWENEENIEKSNPAAPDRVRRWANAPPTLIIHSQRDHRCPWGDGVVTYKVLQRLGVRSRFLTFSDEGHWVLGRENARVWISTIADWMKRCVDGELHR